MSQEKYYRKISEVLTQDAIDRKGNKIPDRFASWKKSSLVWMTVEQSGRYEQTHDKESDLGKCSCLCVLVGGFFSDKKRVVLPRCLFYR